MRDVGGSSKKERSPLCPSFTNKSQARPSKEVCPGEKGGWSGKDSGKGEQLGWELCLRLATTAKSGNLGRSPEKEDWVSTDREEGGELANPQTGQRPAHLSKTPADRRTCKRQRKGRGGKENHRSSRRETKGLNLARKSERCWSFGSLEARP